MSRDRILAVVFGVLFLAATGAAAYLYFQINPHISTFNEKFSYALGQQLGQSIVRQKMDLDGRIIGSSITDFLDKKPKRISQEEMREVLTKYMNEKKQSQLEKFLPNKKASEEFLEKHKTQKGVQVTQSGLQFQEIRPGRGKQPKLSDEVEVQYRGTTIDGREFDSSFKNKAPARLDMAKVIPAWSEALQMMKEGAKVQLAVPYELAYGTDGEARAGILPYSALLFEIELLRVFPNAGVVASIKAGIKQPGPTSEKNATAPKPADPIHK